MKLANLIYSNGIRQNKKMNKEEMEKFIEELYETDPIFRQICEESSK